MTQTRRRRYAACIACAAWIPRLTTRRIPRILFVFCLGALSHAALAFFAGTGFALVPVIGIVAAIAGEAFDLSRQLSRLRTHSPTEVPLVLSLTLVKKWGLTEREREVAELLLRRLTYLEMGAHLFVSIPTVKTHASRVYAK